MDDTQAVAGRSGEIGPMPPEAAALAFVTLRRPRSSHPAMEIRARPSVATTEEPDLAHVAFLANWHAPRCREQVLLRRATPVGSPTWRMIASPTVTRARTIRAISKSPTAVAGSKHKLSGWQSRAFDVR